MRLTVTSVSFKMFMRFILKKVQLVEKDVYLIEFLRCLHDILLHDLMRLQHLMNTERRLRCDRRARGLPRRRLAGGADSVVGDEGLLQVDALGGGGRGGEGGLAVVDVVAHGLAVTDVNFRLLNEEQ